ncbi:MAG: DUF1109 family protein [bacterium]|nr:DUF1109 family protein [bacterium]
MSPSTERLIRDLATDLPPVRPLARLRSVAALALSLSAPFYAYWYFTYGFRHQFQQGRAPEVMYLLVAVAIVLLAIGGALFGLASAVPGRNADARRGRSLFGTGLGMGLLLLLWQWLAGETSLGEASRTSAYCVRGAALLAIPAALVAAGFVCRGVSRSLPVALAAGCAGGMALASLVVHSTCPHPDPLHMVLGHAMAPLCGAVVLFATASVAVALGLLRDGRSPADQYSGT